MTVPVLRGTEVVLRPVEETDHPLIMAWQNDPEVWWWMDYDRTFTLEDIHESEARATVAQSLSPEPPSLLQAASMRVVENSAMAMRAVVFISKAKTGARGPCRAGPRDVAREPAT